jgi:hypothetical protein
MEMENRYASKGVGGTALGLAIGALGVEALRGGFNGILGGGGNGCCNEDHTVNRYEAAQQARIAELETEVKLRDANTFTMGEMNKLRDYVDRRFECVNSSINAQAVYNATNTAALTCVQGQVAQLMSLTKMVVPNGSICPGWGDVTVSITPATTTTP